MYATFYNPRERPFAAPPIPIPSDSGCSARSRIPCWDTEWSTRPASPRSPARWAAARRRHLLNQIAPDMTVAHRLSTIRNLDWEFVIDKGRMVEEGSFHMLGDDGQFRSAHLVAMQKL